MADRLLEDGWHVDVADGYRRLLAEIDAERRGEKRRRRLENRLQKGDKIPPNHLRAWRLAREEVVMNVMRWLRLVIQNFFAYTGKLVQDDRLLQIRLPDELWDRIRNFLENLKALPCWIDPHLSTVVFSSKENFDFWDRVFATGKSPNGIQVLAAPLDLARMIQSSVNGGQR